MSNQSLEPTLRNLALAFIARAFPLPCSEPPETTSDPEVAMLRAVLDRFGGAAGLPQSLAEIGRAAHGGDATLVTLTTEFGLNDAELLAAALCAGVDADLWTGRLVAYVQRGIGGSRPLLGLLAQAFAAAVPGENLTPCELAEGPAFDVGLLTFQSEAEPLAERAVAMPLPVARALADREMPWPGRVLPAPGRFELSPTLKRQASDHAAMLGGDHPPVLIIRSPSRDDAIEAVRELVAALDANAVQPRTPVFLEPDAMLAGLEVWLRLRRHVPVFLFDSAPGETKQVPWIHLHRGPVLALAGPDGGVAAAWRDEIEWVLPLPTLKERSNQWEKLGLTSEDAAEFARTHRQGGARIAQVARLAKIQANAAAVTPRQVRAVSRSGGGTGLGSLAQLVTGEVADAAFIRPPDLAAQLDALCARCRLRDGLSDHLGPSAQARYSPGVRALFTGPSGTGKTLAASWLATQLGLPLYRVDLAAISSKFIGETERNLSQLLAAAEHTAAVLLFDEADSLFGKRTDIRDSVDRFANAQTNYLLQRIETFEGIALLTSNSRAHFDAAFARRLDAVLDFPPPGVAERCALWTAHLGEKVLGERELALLAAHAELPGGQIRNIVFAAAVEAQAKAEALAFPHLLRALAAEYRKAGRTPPAELSNPLETS